MSKRASRVCAAAAAGLIAMTSAAMAQSTAAIAPSLAQTQTLDQTQALGQTQALDQARALDQAQALARAQALAQAQAEAQAQAQAQTPTATAAPTPALSQVPHPASDNASAEDIRDIRGPKAIFPLALVLVLLAGAALLALGGFILWHRRRRRQSRALRYFEIALQRLEKLRELMHPGSVREFSSAISDTVRRYIEAGFEVTATHQTTEEFLHDILKHENSPLARHRSLLDEFLRQCDLAKFAGMSLSMDNMESLYRSAHSFIVGTSPAQSEAEARSSA